MKLNRHHISYDKQYWPEWTVDIPGYFHRTITFLSRMKATDLNYALFTNCLHSLAHEWNRMRMELDIGTEDDD
jgi:hypothetical protein